MAQAALLQLGPESWLSHHSAGALLGLGGMSRVPPVHVLVPYGHGTMLARRQPWPVRLTIHRSRTYRGERASHVEGLRHTGPERTIVDVAGLTPLAARDLVAEAMINNLTTTSALSEALVQAGRAPGVRSVRSALAALEPSAARARSHPELRIRRWLVDAGLPEPILNFEITDRAGRMLFEVDLAYPELMLGYEYDSDAFHSLPSQVSRDRQRHRRLARIAWDVRHLSSADLRTPKRLVQEIASDLERARLLRARFASDVP